MPTIARIDNARIAIYPKDHNPPHFHVVGPEFKAQIRIKDLSLLAGTLPPHVHAKVLAWAAAHRPLLALKWIEIAVGE